MRIYSKTGSLQYMRKILPLLSLSLFSFYGCKAPAKNTGDYEVKTSIASNFNRQDESRYFTFDPDDTIEVTGYYVGCDGHTDYTERWIVNSADSSISNLKNITNVDICKIGIEQVAFKGRYGTRLLSYINTIDEPFYDVLGRTFSTGNNVEYRSIKEGGTSRLYFNPSHKNTGVFGEDFYLDQYHLSWASKINEDKNTIDISFSFSESGENIDTVEVFRDDMYKKPAKSFTYSFTTNQLQRQRQPKLTLVFSSPISLRGVDVSTEAQKKSSSRSILGAKGEMQFSIPTDTPISYCTLDIGQNSSQKFYPGALYTVNLEDILKENPLVLSFHPAHTKKSQRFSTLVFARCYNASESQIITRRFDIIISPK